jgi:hypothetical protein
VIYKDGDSTTAVSTLSSNSQYSYYYVPVNSGVDGTPSGAVQGITSSCETLNATCSPNSNPVLTGQEVTFNTTPSGETGNYNYLWDGTVNKGPSIVSEFKKTFAATGLQTVPLTITSVYPTDGTPYSRTLVLSCTVTVNASCATPAPTVDLRVDGSNGPVSLTCGSNTDKTISWTTTNMPAGSVCTASGKDTWSGSKTGGSGSYTQASGPFGSDTTLTLSCSNCAGTASDSVQIDLSGSASDFVLSASPQTLKVYQIPGATGIPYSDSTIVTVSIAGCSSFNNPVDLSLQEGSIGGIAIDAVFNSTGNDNRLPQSEYATGATLKIRPSNSGEYLTPGTYDIHVVGTEVGGSGTTHTVLVHLVVENKAPGFKEI